MDTSQGSKVPAGALLSKFTAAIVRREPGLGAVRDQVIATLGAEAMVDSAAVVANFQRMVRIADGLGIPIDEAWRDRNANLRDRLGVGAFASSTNTPAGRDHAASRSERR